MFPEPTPPPLRPEDPIMLLVGCVLMFGLFLAMCLAVRGTGRTTSRVWKKVSPVLENSVVTFLTTYRNFVAEAEANKPDVATGGHRAKGMDAVATSMDYPDNLDLDDEYVDEFL